MNFKLISIIIKKTTRQCRIRLRWVISTYSHLLPAIPFPLFNSCIYKLRINFSLSRTPSIKVSSHPNLLHLHSPTPNKIACLSSVLQWHTELNYHYIYSIVLYLSICVSSLLNVSFLKVETGLICWWAKQLRLSC